MKKNDIITLDITATSSDGYGIGRYNGIAVFVPDAAEGDTVQTRILKVKKTYAYGKIEQLITPSVHRTDPDCPVFSKCGGCAYRHISYNKETQIKAQKVYDCINRIGGIDLKPSPVIAAEEIYAYRNKAQLPISLNGKAGFFSRHSHRIIETDGCLLTPEIFNKITLLTQNWIAEFDISVYNEAEHKGLLRHLYLRIAKATQQLMVVLVINGDRLPHSDEYISRLSDLLGNRLKSVQLNINKKDTNVILDNKCITLYGENYITDVLCGLKIRISPLSFYQVNHDMTEMLYKKAAEYLKPDGKNIIDLYCGTGTIGLSMASKAKNIIGVEIIPEAIADAKLNATENNINNARFICGDATVAAKELAQKNIVADAVILDPPRKGCSEELLKTVANYFKPERIIYISCGPATLARDAKMLSALNYKLKEYTPVDLFPRTHHIETAALFLKGE